MAATTSTDIRPKNASRADEGAVSIYRFEGKQETKLVSIAMKQFASCQNRIAIYEAS